MLPAALVAAPRELSVAIPPRSSRAEVSRQMMTATQFMHLAHDLADREVLSVYLPREQADPGARGAWRARFTAVAAEARAAISSSRPVELESFDAALAYVEASLEDVGRVLPSGGWAAFATPDRLISSDSLPYPPALSVRFGTGMRVGPYLPALRATAPIGAVVLDQWRARVLRVEGGRLEETADLFAPDAVDDVTDGTRKGAPRSMGTRGATGQRGATRSDTVERARQAEQQRLIKDAAQALRAMEGDVVGYAVGGARDSVAGLLTLLEASPLPCATVEGVGVTSDRPHILEAVGEATDDLVEARQDARLEECREADAGEGHGWNAVVRALAAGAVDTLFVSEALLGEDPDRAEELIAATIAQGGTVEAVGGAVGGRLREDDDGVAARLRFHPNAPPTRESA